MKGCLLFLGGTVMSVLVYAVISDGICWLQEFEWRQITAGKGWTQNKERQLSTSLVAVIKNYFPHHTLSCAFDG